MFDNRCRIDCVVFFKIRSGSLLRVVDAFRRRFTNIPFLFVADSFGLRLARELLARGARGLLLYSDGPDEIIRGLDYALKGGITISPMVLSDILESFQQCAQPKIIYFRSTLFLWIAGY